MGPLAPWVPLLRHVFLDSFLPTSAILYPVPMPCIVFRCASPRRFLRARQKPVAVACSPAGYVQAYGAGELSRRCPAASVVMCVPIQQPGLDVGLARGSAV